MNRIYNISFILFFFVEITLSQKTESKLSMNTITLGEEVKYTLEIECNRNDKITYSPNKNSIVALRASSSKNTPDSLKLEILSPFHYKKENIQGKTYWTGEYSLICFDTGYLILPPITVHLNKKPVEMPPVLLRVNLMAKNKNIDLYDIEENFSTIPEPATDWLGGIKTIGLWLVLLACIGALVYFVFFYKNEKVSTALSVRNRTPQEKSKDELTILMKKQLWRNGQEKEHFTELSWIIRRFLNEEFNNRFEGKTSFEIQLILKNEHFSSKQINKLGLILNVSDMVKFAKSSVEEVGVQTIYQKALEFINDTENV